MISVLLWWLSMQVIGWLALPLTMRIFRWLPDRGYSLSKSFGLLLASYFLWIGAYTNLLRNNLGGILFSILLVGGLSTWVYLKRPAGDPSLPEFLRQKKLYILVVENLFLFGLILWAVLRAYAPYKIMETGGEKFMEIAFLNSILKSPHFPPQDPWLSGFSISYYYFGYIMMGLLTNLTGVPSGVGFDLYDALLFALVGISALGIVYNLVFVAHQHLYKSKSPPAEASPILYGLLGALLVPVMGNLEGLLEALYSKGILPNRFWEWLNIPGLTAAPVSNTWYPGFSGGWWWWRASRVLQDFDLRGQPMGVSPITEFPFFSFLLGDNHPHVLALPFVLMAIGLAYNLFLMRSSTLSQQPASDSPSQSLSHLPWWNPAAFVLGGDGLLFIFAGLILGALGFLNTWDFPIYLVLVVLAYGLADVMKTHRLSRDVLIRGISLAVGTFLLAVLIYIFFYVGFSSQAGGILPYIFPPTRLPQYLVMFGTFIIINLAFLLFYLIGQVNRDHRLTLVKSFFRWWLGILLACLVIAALFFLLVSVSDLGKRLAGEALQNPTVQLVLGGLPLPEALATSLLYRLRDPWLVLLLSAFLALIIALTIWLISSPGDEAVSDTPVSVTPKPSPVDLFAFLLIFTGLALTLSVEFFYLRDSFGVRMNTIFKFYYQGWVMLGCACAYGLYWLFNRLNHTLGRVSRYTIGLIAGFFILSGLVYSFMAYHSRAQGFQTTPNLDGSSAIAQSNPDDWAAIQWLLTNIQGAPIILEAPGKSYNYEGRISAFSGYPALLGWAVHESQWRGNYDEQGKREPDIATIFTTHDDRLMLELLHKWGISYVIIGLPENNYIQQLCKDPGRNCSVSAALRKFPLALEPVFQHGQTAVFRVPNP